MGKRSQEVQARKRLAGAAPVYPILPGVLLRVFMIADPASGSFHRFEVYKSFAGKRKIDLVIDRGEPIRGKSITWLMALLRKKMAILPEIGNA